MRLEAAQVLQQAQEKRGRVCLSNCWFSETPCYGFRTTGGNVANSLLFGVMYLASSSLSHLSGIEQHRRAAVTKRAEETHPINRSGVSANHVHGFGRFNLQNTSRRTHGQNLLYLRGELSQLTCTAPRAVICHGP
jgi:hypothetical protein